jgi:hypothetical protein
MDSAPHRLNLATHVRVLFEGLAQLSSDLPNCRANAAESSRDLKGVSNRKQIRKRYTNWYAALIVAATDSANVLSLISAIAHNVRRVKVGFAYATSIDVVVIALYTLYTNRRPVSEEHVWRQH